MAVMGNFNFSFFLRLTWEFLDLESERGGSVCWPNNKITRRMTRAFARLVLKIQKFACCCIFTIFKDRTIYYHPSPYSLS